MALESANTFSCKKCGYGITIPCEVGSPVKLVASSSSTSSTSATHLKTLSRSALRRRRRRQNKPPVTSPTSPLAHEPSFVIDRLNNDCLLSILDFLPTTDILVFARAYKPVSTLIHQHNIIAHREIRCFALKKSSTETILGVGVSWSREEKALSSPFDYISVEAFETLGIRIGVRRERYSHFLPLAITASHFHKASPKILEQLELLQKHIISEGGPSPARINGRSTSPYNYKTVCAFANNIVVRLMRSCDGPNGLRTGQTILHASERALTDYFSLMHLLISLACAYPSIIQSATLELQRFVRHPSKRVKAFAPNLGELIVQRVLVTGVSWEEMRLPLLGEALTRNVVWILDGRQGAGCGELALLENESVSDYRLATTFRASRTSLKLPVFQHFFLEKLRGLVAPGSDLPTLKNAIDSRYGLPPPEMPAQLVTAIQEIDAVDNFGAFSARLSLPRPTKSWMTSYLQDRIRDSERVGYHVFPDTLSRASLISWRAYKDPVWAAGYPKVRPVRPSHSELHSSFFLNSRRGQYG